jgi:hypothetical protein
MTDPRLIAARRLMTHAVALFREQGLSWWEPGDAQEATIEIDDEWMTGLIGGRPLFRVPLVVLDRLAADIRAKLH